MVYQVYPGEQEQRESPVSLDRTVTLVLMEYKDRKEILALKEVQGHQDKRALPGLQDHKDHPVNLVEVDHLVCQERRDHREH